MAQQKGRELLIKRGDGAVAEVFSSVCGIDARSITINNNLVDATVPDCAVPGGVVAEYQQYGVQSIGFTGSGIWTSSAAEKAVGADVIAQTAHNYQVIIPGFGTFQGETIIESLQLSGGKEGSESFDATWRFRGTVLFTPE